MVGLRQQKQVVFSSCQVAMLVDEEVALQVWVMEPKLQAEDVAVMHERFGPDMGWMGSDEEVDHVSRAEVASSRRMTLGFRTKARAMARR